MLEMDTENSGVIYYGEDNNITLNFRQDLTGYDLVIYFKSTSPYVAKIGMPKYTITPDGRGGCAVNFVLPKVDVDLFRGDNVKCQLWAIKGDIKNATAHYTIPLRTREA